MEGQDILMGILMGERTLDETATIATWHPCSICGEPVRVSDLLWREFHVREHNFRNYGEDYSVAEFVANHAPIGAWHDDCAVVEFGEEPSPGRAVQFDRCQRPGCCVPRMMPERKVTL